MITENYCRVDEGGEKIEIQNICKSNFKCIRKIFSRDFTFPCK